MRWIRHLASARFDGLSLLGDRGAGRLLPVQALHTFGETMFAVSLVGSLFFSVSLDAARPRIVLYLVVTMAPFLVLAPLIGPLIDRVRGGHRMVLLAALGGRALLALILATQLKGLLLYPLAFSILVLAKVFSVSRNSLVPVLVTDRSHLVVVNSRLARIGAVAGAPAALVAVAILDSFGSGWVLRTGALAYGVGALLALRLPPPHSQENVSPVVEQLELSGPDVRSATLAMGSLRAAIGFLVFHIGFVMKRAGEPAWFFGLLAISIGLGAFVGTFLAPRVRRLLGERVTLTAALASPAVMALVTALRFHRVTAVALVFVLGFSASVARRAFDCVVQTEAPHARRGQAYSGLEARLELGWVGGALAAVVVSAPGWLGVTVLTVWLSGLAIGRVIQRRGAAVIESAAGPATLPLRLLETAEALAARGDRQQAVFVAVAAADTVTLVGAPVNPELADLRELGRVAATDQDEHAAEKALRLAHQLVAEAYPLSD
jgi:MFS family permease